MILSGTRMYSFPEAVLTCDHTGHGKTCYPTGYGECNTPPGHDMIYELYMCIVPGCGKLYGVPMGIRYKHESPDKIVFLDLHGLSAVRIEWMDVRKELFWDGDKWILWSELTK